MPFTDPVESYSTTPQLLEDLKIPEGTKGRIATPAPRERKAGEEHRRSTSRTRSRRRSGSSEAEKGSTDDKPTNQERADRPRRKRVRRRNGQVVKGAESTTEPTENN